MIKHTMKYHFMSLLLWFGGFAWGMEVQKQDRRKIPSLFYLSQRQVIKNAASQPVELTIRQVQSLPEKSRKKLKRVINKCTNVKRTKIRRSDVAAIELLALSANPIRYNKFEDSILFWCLNRNKGEAAYDILLNKKMPINVNHKNIYGAAAIDLVEKVESKELRDKITCELFKRGVPRSFFDSISSGFSTAQDFLSTIIGDSKSNQEDIIFRKVFEVRTALTIEEYRNYVQMLPEKIKRVLPSAVKKPLNPAGMTYLHYATTPEDVEKLLILGADVNAETKSKETPLHTMLQRGNCGAALKLIKNISHDLGYCNRIDGYNMTPLSYGVLTRHRNLVKELIKKGGDLGYGYFNGKQVLAPCVFLASTTNKNLIRTALNWKIVKTLDPNIRLEALTKALEKKRKFFFDRLSLDGNFLNTFYETRIGHVNLLMYMLYDQRTDGLLKLLCSPRRWNLDVNAKNENGISPIMVAGRFYPYVVKALIELGALVNDVDYEGNTPLHHIVSESKFTENGSNKFNDIEDGSFDKNDKGVIAMKFLLEKDLSIIDTQNGEGNTPLHIAAERQWDNAIKFLVNQGANLTLKNKKGDQPCDIHNDGLSFNKYYDYLQPK